MSSSENENNDTEKDSQEIITNEPGATSDKPVSDESHCDTPHTDTPAVPVAEPVESSAERDLRAKLASLTMDYKRLQIATDENVPVDLLPDTANEDELRDYVRRLRLFAEDSRHQGRVDRVQQAATIPTPQTLGDVSRSIFDVLRNAK